MRYRSLIFPVALIFALLMPAAIVSAAYVSTNDHFDETWARTDKPVADGQVSRTWMWGPRPFTSPIEENYVESPGGKRLVQYFDKSRMEITDPAADSNSIWYVTNGLLSTELITGRMQVGHNEFQQRQPAALNVAGDADDSNGPTYASFAEVLDEPAIPTGWLVTQRIARDGSVSNDEGLGSRGVTVTHVDDVTNHSVAGPFWEFMNANGAVWLGYYDVAPLFENPYFATGRPITEPYWASLKVAGTVKDVLVQCFERRCLTYTPENPSGWQVEAGNVGQHYYTWRYNAPVPDPPPLPEPPPPPDVDCDNFASQAEAQAFFEANGGPANDPHDLDADGDGIACEALPGGPGEPAPPSAPNCHSSYPTVCIPPPPPDLDCGDIPYSNFTVVGSDPHRFDNDNDGIGCEG